MAAQSVSALDDQRPHVAVVVVHGVGEVVPGEIAGTLIATMKTTKGFFADRTLEIARLPDAAIGEASGAEQRRYVSGTFPAHFHTGRVDSGARVTFAEMYWADLTRVGSGRVNTLLGLVRVMFEAHYLIDAMLNRRGGFLTRNLRFLLLLLSQVLRGPLAALSICTAVMCWVGINARHVGIDQAHGWLQHVFRGASVESAFIAALAALVLAALALAYWLWRLGDLTWLPMLLWTAVCSGLIAATLAVSPTGGVIAAALDIGWVYDQLALLWRIWAGLFFLALLIALALGLGSAVLSLVRRASRSERRIGAAALTATGTLAIQFILWTTLTGTMLLPLLNRVQEIVLLTAINVARDGKSAEQFFASQGTPAILPNDGFKPADLYARLDKLLDVPLFFLRDFDWTERFQYTYGYNAVVVIAFLSAFLLLVALRRAVVVVSGNRLAIAHMLLPRLLFNIVATSVLLGYVFVQLFINVILGEELQLIAREIQTPGFVTPTSPLRFIVREIQELAEAFGLSKGTVPDLIVYNRYTILSLAALLAIGLPLALGDRLNNALHVARDLIDHQYGPREGRAYAAAADLKLNDAERRPRRARIANRLLTLLAELRSRGRIDGVVFVAHSQGSVILYDFLASSAPRGFPEIAGIKPAIVTCGSPLTHLYERYFHDYRYLGRGLADLAPSHLGWVNLYRVDDYIGTHVGRPDCVHNIALPAGGHADYWQVKDLAVVVREAIEQATPSSSRTDGEPATTLGL